YNALPWGFDNDLWLIKKDGTQAQKIWQTPPGYAALHPHFSSDGRYLIFAERVPQGNGVDNPYQNWRIRIGVFNINLTGTQMLSNVIITAPNGPGFYEGHEFTANGKILYSYSATPGIVENIYVSDPAGTNVVNLTNTAGIWNEHGHVSPKNPYV